jgi:hypothetical protein
MLRDLAEVAIAPKSYAPTGRQLRGPLDRSSVQDSVQQAEGPVDEKKLILDPACGTDMFMSKAIAGQYFATWTPTGGTGMFLYLLTMQDLVHRKHSWCLTIARYPLSRRWSIKNLGNIRKRRKRCWKRDAKLEERWSVGSAMLSWKRDAKRVPSSQRDDTSSNC